MIELKTAGIVKEIRGLIADAPSPRLEEKLALFGQFVGDWEGEAQFFEPDGAELGPPQGGGEIHWGWILDGMAVQDVWSIRDRETGRLVPMGTTVRFYDPKIDAWHSVWITPLGNDVAQFVGRKVGDKIVLEGKDSTGKLLRWSFAEIKSDSFTWIGEESKDNGRNWVLATKMHIRRQHQENLEM